MNHYKGITAIHKVISEKQAEIERLNKIIDEPELMSDYYFAKNDIDNLNNNIKSDIYE